MITSRSLITASNMQDHEITESKEIRYALLWVTCYLCDDPLHRMRDCLGLGICQGRSSTFREGRRGHTVQPERSKILREFRRSQPQFGRTAT